MATLAGSVSIDPTTGAATGSGMALVLYNTMIANPPYSSIVVNPSVGITLQAVINMRSEVARMCNTFALICDHTRWTLQAATGSFSPTPWDFVFADSTSAPIAITLPVPSSANAGQSIRIKKHVSSVNAVTVATSGGSLIDSLSSVVIADLSFLELTSSGGNWWKTGQ